VRVGYEGTMILKEQIEVLPYSRVRVGYEGTMILKEQIEVLP
jgi:hypothetical protein